MAHRTIMIFPDFEQMEIIESIREKYDPLYQLVKPHITVVFPFDMDVSNEELSKILERRLAHVRPFAIKLEGFRTGADSFGNYLFLEVTKGKDEIVQIHDVLYGNEFAPLDLGLPYEPHLTVGKLDTVEELEQAFHEVKETNICFTSMVTKISVEMIGEQDESIIILEKQFD